MHYEARLSALSRIALENMSWARWESLELLVPIRVVGSLQKTAAGLFVRSGQRSWMIQAEPVDLAPKVEVFRLSAREIYVAEEKDRYKLRAESADELLAAFVGVGSRLSVIARRHTASDWQGAGIAEVVVEDVIVVRDASGQQAYITADSAEPGAIRLSRTLDTLEGTGIAIVSIATI